MSLFCVSVVNESIISRLRESILIVPNTISDMVTKMTTLAYILPLNPRVMTPPAVFMHVIAVPLQVGSSLRVIE
ncbi:Uncharacterised protein [Vibrio cholerae]|nr:Uncharacterised protein [Vibrio cholerae]